MIEFLQSMRQVATDAILDRHAASALGCFPSIAGTPDEKLMREENETYRPYAEKDANAVIDALIARATSGSAAS
jgi:hypothetical protein